MKPDQQRLERLLAAARRAGPPAVRAPAAGLADRVVARWTARSAEPSLLGLWERFSRRAAVGLAVVAVAAGIATWDLLPGGAEESVPGLEQEFLAMLP